MIESDEYNEREEREDPSEILARKALSEKLKQEFDGVHFEHKVEASWNLLLVNFEDKPNCHFEFCEELGSNKYLILLFEETEDPDFKEIAYFQAYLGDPVKFIRNQMAAGSSGVVVKKCEKGFGIIQSIVSKLDKNSKKIIDTFYKDLSDFLGVVKKVEV